MNEIVLDTTVLVKGIIPPLRKKIDGFYEEQLRLHRIARHILTRVEENRVLLKAPAIVLIEVAAVGARLTGKEERGILASDYVREHAEIIYDVNLLEEAIRVAAKTKISGFDSVFIACAKIANCLLITDDKKMYEAATKFGVRAKLLREIVF